MISVAAYKEAFKQRVLSGKIEIFPLKSLRTPSRVDRYWLCITDDDGYIPAIIATILFSFLNVIYRIKLD